MIKYRHATQQDANQLAILFDIASVGMINYSSSVTEQFSEEKLFLQNELIILEIC